MYVHMYMSRCDQARRNRPKYSNSPQQIHLNLWVSGRRGGWMQKLERYWATNY
jgi:hypothetical protein